MTPPQYPYHELARSPTPPPPSIKVHFFYTSPLPIDDPLTPVPATSSATLAQRHPARPFSDHDNVEIEEAWQSLQKQLEGEAHDTALERVQEATRPVSGVGSARGSRSKERATSKSVKEETAKLLGDEAAAQGSLVEGGRRGTMESSKTGEARKELVQQLQKEDTDTALVRDGPISTLKRKFSDAGDAVERLRTRLTDQSDERPPTPTSPTTKRRSESPAEDVSLPLADESGGITGMPFQRMPTRTRADSRPTRATDRECHSRERREGGGRSFSRATVASQAHSISASTSGSLRGRPKAAEKSSPEATVPVGVSRLHLVRLPALLMEPIYWSPVHDISSVIRGTWFHKDSLLPVDADIANQLEVGYLELKPWTEAWNDELNSAVEVGPEGEAKILHPLWPIAPEPVEADSRPATAVGGAEPFISSMTQESRAGVLEGAVIAAPPVDEAPAPPPKAYEHAKVIYANDREAYIAVPSWFSTAAGKRPISTIRRNKLVGIPVIRGFDMSDWNKLHPSKKPVTPKILPPGSQLPRSGNLGDINRKPFQVPSDDSQVTDLVLVIHG
jgi:hypothetical protein